MWMALRHIVFRMVATSVAKWFSSSVVCQYGYTHVMLILMPDVSRTNVYSSIQNSQLKFLLFLFKHQWQEQQHYHLLHVPYSIYSRTWYPAEFNFMAIYFQKILNVFLFRSIFLFLYFAINSIENFLTFFATYILSSFLALLEVSWDGNFQVRSIQTFSSKHIA